MEVNTRRNLQDDQTSECGTFGSNYCPSSQSRKISIGIMIDPVAKKRLGAIREEKVAKPGKRENIGGLKRSIRETGETKQTEAPQQATSPWRSTRSKSPVSETPQCRNGTSNTRPAGGRLKKQRREIDAPVTHSVQFFADQTPISHFSGGKQETFKVFTYKRKGSKNGDSQEFTFANAQKGGVPDKAVAQDRNEDGRTESLRIKLWEILGKVSSPKSQPSDSRAQEKNADNLMSNQGQVQKADADGKPLRNSDTIETDSENPDLNLTRPVTRSLTRRRGSTKVRPEKKRTVPSSNYRQKLEENNAFSFAEGLLRKGNAKNNGGSSMSLEKKGYKNLSSFRPRSNCFSENNDTGVNQKGFSGKVDVNDGPSTSTRKNSQRKSYSIEPSRVAFAHKNADEIQEKTRSETLFSADRTSSFGNKMKNTCRSPPRDVTENSVSKSGNKEKEGGQWLREDSQKSLNKQISQEQEDINTPEVEKKGQQEECLGPSLKNIVDTHEDFPSPTLKFHTLPLTPSPTLKPRSEQVNEDPNSPALEKTELVAKNIRSFRILQASKAASISQSESSDHDVEEFGNSPETSLTPPQRKINEENDLSDSSPEDKDPDSSEEGSPISKGLREEDFFSPVIRPVERSKFFFSPVKDFHSHAASRDKNDPISPSLKGTSIGEGDCAEDQLLSEHNQGDELERLIMLFTLYLEKFRNKMKMATRKKSSDILLSVSEEINLQLQNVKSQIQKDLGKLTGFSKLKRKEIETTFQEQEEKLKMIHDKFKEDIHHHLQDCKTSVQELEEHQIVINEAVKKQKASHQKLLTQVEEAIGERLKEAQRSIETVHKLAGGRMAQLKHIVAECLNENVLS